MLGSFPKTFGCLANDWEMIRIICHNSQETLHNYPTIVRPLGIFGHPVSQPGVTWPRQNILSFAIKFHATSVNPRRVVIGVEQGLLAIWCILLQHYMLHISIELKLLHMS